MSAIIDTVIFFIIQLYNESALGFISLLSATAGSVFALIKWSIQIQQKRADLVKELLCKIRDDDDIATIFAIIDWGEGIIYDGKIQADPNIKKTIDEKISDDVLSKSTDKALSHYSYLCYLLKTKALTKKDIVMFEYSLRRLIDNIHIKNYLFSLYHWSKHLNVECSFSPLIWYSLKKGYLKKEFKHIEAQHYHCYLEIPSSSKN